MEKCIFNCSKTGHLLSAGSKRIHNIITSSKIREDHLYIDLDLENRLQQFPHMTVKCHKSCVSSYTSKSHISRFAKRHISTEDLQNSSLPPQRRKRTNEFHFKKHCFICGEQCLPVDKKNPSRWRVVYQCRTTDRPGMKSFKDVIQEKCSERGDAWADEVMVRLAGVATDLFAAGAQYHKDCYIKFICGKKTSTHRERTLSPNTQEEICIITGIMEQNQNRVWTSVELHELYLAQGLTQTPLSRRHFINNLLKHMGDTVVEMKISGCASLIAFKECLPYKLTKAEEEPEDPVDSVIQKILEECNEIPKPCDYDLSQFVVENSCKFTSPTLLTLLTKLISKGAVNRPSHSIAQSIQSHITKTTTPTTLGLAVQLHHRFGSKELVTLLHEYGYIASYDEVMRFKTSAAKYVGEQDLATRGLTGSSRLISCWCDNYDLNVNTPSGNRETHCMAMEFTQNHDVNTLYKTNDYTVIPRLSKSVMAKTNLAKLHAVSFEHYQGSKKPLPITLPTHSDRPICLDKLQDSLAAAIEEDVKWLSLATMKTEDPECEWGGYMTREARVKGKPGRVTDYVFGPLVDATPSHPDTVLTTLCFMEKFSQNHGQEYVVVSADMQLYQVILHIKWSDPDRWNHLIPRPGGMHTLMSFIGAIGTLMKGSGLEEIISVSFGRVNSILNGKVWPRALRAFRMVVAGLLMDVMQSGKNSVADLEKFLTEASMYPTGKMWVECFIMPVITMLLFIQAERECNWVLHLYSMEQMIPFFFAAGHWQYARYITWHCSEMKKCLPDEIEQKFMNGDHVCRHRDGVWNGVFSDQFGEQTYIRYGKSRGGLVGLTLSPNQVARWVLSNNICNTVSIAMDTMFDSSDEEYDATLDKHKEEGQQRRKLDFQDRQKIHQEIQLHVNPLTTENNSLVNIYNGCIADERVNVHNANDIGTHMANKFKEGLPSGFYSPLHKEVITMECMKKSVRLSDSTVVYDMEKLFGRLLVLSQKRDMSLEELFTYELAPVPSSLFDNYGRMRKTSKTSLVRKLGLFKADEPEIDCFFIDGNEMLYHIVWPKAGTVRQLCDNFNKAIARNKKEVYVVFDKYSTSSIKAHERYRRAGDRLYPNYNLKLDTDLPSRDRVMKNTHNKQQVIKLICEANTKDSVHMVGMDSIYGHEEADVSIICHLRAAIKDGKKELQVIASDTDIFLLLIYYCWKWQLSKKQIGITMKKSDGSIIDIIASATHLGDKCRDILAMHALTGCDTTSYPFGKGKQTALKFLPKVNLQSLGDSTSNIEDVLATGRYFFCLLYGSQLVMPMEKLRHKIFASRIESPKIKSLPPTDGALTAHILRCHLQVLLWKSAEDLHPPKICTEELGWIMSNGNLEPKFGVTKMAPPELMKVVACGCISDAACSRNSCSCKAAGLSCTSFCKCEGQDICHNPHTAKQQPSDEEDNESDIE